MASDLDAAIRERLDDEVCRLATAIRLNAHHEDVADRCMWRSAFRGGNYTLDAKRVLKAARALGVTEEVEQCEP